MGVTFNPFFGNFDFTGDDGPTNTNNFSYLKVLENTEVTIDDGQEMIISQDTIYEGNIQGEIYQLPDSTDYSFFWSKIPNNKSIRIPPDRLMLYVSPFMVDGNLLVQGTLYEVA